MSGDTGRGATTACVRLAQKVLATKGKVRRVIRIEILSFSCGFAAASSGGFGERESRRRKGNRHWRAMWRRRVLAFYFTGPTFKHGHDLRARKPVPEFRCVPPRARTDALGKDASCFILPCVA